MHYTTDDGRQVLDGTSGLWCVSAGHCRTRIADAVKAQIDTLDFAPSFQVSHPGPFMAAQRIAELAPADLNKVFFTNSGSEAVDTSLKIALPTGARRARPSQRVRRPRAAYHGVGFGGISVGGMVGNRKVFNAMLPRVDHMRHTFDLEHHAYCKGEPEWGAHLADELEQRIIRCTTRRTSPRDRRAGDGLDRRADPAEGLPEAAARNLRQVRLLLIFDEVITGFGRLGKPFASQYFDVIPTCSRSPRASTTRRCRWAASSPRRRLRCVHERARAHRRADARLHVFGAPARCAATLATQDLYREEDLFNRAAEMSKYIEEGIHSLKGAPT
jgi:beta-alanine--pyruvate transaminase